MKFGTNVIVNRGSAGNTGLGKLRQVRGILVGARQNQRFVRLTEDDPFSAHGWDKVGQIGRFAKSSVVKA